MGTIPKRVRLVTLPYLTAIDFDALTQAVAAGGPLDDAFAKANMANSPHPAFAVTGGDFARLGNSFLLIYGHRFDGEYTPGGGPAFQEYTNSVRVFSVSTSRGASGPELAVSFKGSVPQVTSGMAPDNPFHRRDLTVKPALHPSGAPRIGVYGGVFKGGRMEGYLHPIYIASGAANVPSGIQGLGINIGEDTTALQLLSQYDCATLQLYSASTSSMYSTFFGGISYYYWDKSCQCLKNDPPDITSGSGWPSVRRQCLHAQGHRRRYGSIPPHGSFVSA